MGHRALIVAWVVIASISLSLVILPPPAAAHTHVTVGEYELIVGWRMEPPVVGVLNGLDLGIEHHLSNGTTVWFRGAEATLNATLITGPASLVKGIEPQFGIPGWYTFDVIPTRAGAYSVRVLGSLNGTVVDRTVALEEVMPASDVEFPVPDPTAPGLQGQVSQLSAQVATLQALIIALGAVGIILGAAALGMGFLLVRRQRAKT